jgi:hypothetical protein
MSVRRSRAPLAASQIEQSQRTNLRRHNRLRMIALTILTSAIYGCATHTTTTTTSSTDEAVATKSRWTEVATEIDPATTQPSYWLDLAALSVNARDFDRLWNAAAETARDFGFTIDRTDYREGEMTTMPLTIAQWFEFWRSDVRTLDALANSSIATVRRTIRFEFTRERDGTFNCYAKVLLERQAIAEQRITSVVSYQSVYRRPLRVSERPSGTRESDEGVILPNRYWYPIGRDQALEAALIDALKKKLRH